MHWYEGNAGVGGARNCLDSPEAAAAAVAVVVAAAEANNADICTIKQKPSNLGLWTDCNGDHGIRKANSIGFQQHHALLIVGLGSS